MASNTKLSMEQKYLLVECVEGNELIGRGKVSFPNSTKEVQEQWQIIADKLNSLNGSKKTWKEWRRSWQDLRAKTKQKAARIRTELRLKTGGGPPKVEKLTDLQEKVLSLMSSAVVHGLEDTEEYIIITDESDVIESTTPCHAKSVIDGLGPDTSVIFVPPPAIAAKHQVDASPTLSPTSVPELSVFVEEENIDSPNEVDVTPSVRKAQPLKRKFPLHSPYISKRTKGKKPKSGVSELLDLEERKLKLQEDTLDFEKEKFQYMKSYRERKLEALQNIAAALRVQSIE